jgi:hypothetical protein
MGSRSRRRAGGSHGAADQLDQLKVQPRNRQGDIATDRAHAPHQANRGAAADIGTTNRKTEDFPGNFALFVPVR